MKHFIIDLLKIETKPRKGLLALEWAVLAYLVLTTLVILFTYTRLENPESMLWGRLRIVAMTMGLWIVYRLVPCKLTQLARVLAQFGLLAWWYPDTYEINRIFPNLDHLVCNMRATALRFSAICVVLSGLFVAHH